MIFEEAISFAERGIETISPGMAEVVT
jgi:hypothetical protein